MPTLLRYDLMTDPFPLQASPASGNLSTATLTIVASNPNFDPDNNSITLQGIIVSIPVGTDSSDLAADDTDIKPVPPSGWKPRTLNLQPGLVQYNFSPKAGTANVGSTGLVFIFNIEVNSQPGTVEVDVIEGSNDCQPPYCPGCQINER